MLRQRPDKHGSAFSASMTKVGWRTWVPLLALVLALVALVLLPVLRARLVDPLHDDLRLEIEPARSIVTRMHLALAMEGALAREFIERRDTLLIAGYRTALADELSAYGELGPLVARLGPHVRTEFNALRVLQKSWHAAIERSLSTAPAARAETDPFHPAEYEKLLVGAARLDEALVNAAEQRWAESAATNRAQRWVTAVLGTIALSALLIVAWLGRGLGLYAAAAERGRADLEQAVEARARLIRGITHDLKNPLNAIVGYAELLEQGIKGPLSAQQLASVTRIHRSAESLLALIGDLLDMSRSESGGLEVLPRETNIASVIQDAVQEYAASAAAAGHRLHVELLPDVPRIATDARRVRQILGNLLSNAIKYTPPGGDISVRATLKSRDGAADDAHWVAIHVIDSGPGIPQNQAAAVFEEFTRLKIHSDQPGAGLGLAIALRISRLLGGDLTLENSANGHGSVFTLWLPLNLVGAGPMPTASTTPFASG
ncbi:MAG: sensor histidine kinase [Gemmatimonadaceae bacterium]